MKTIFSQIINLIYPQTCGICEEIANESICKKCKNKLEELAVCNIHNYSHQSFTRHLYIFEYKAIIREKIIQYKFSNKAYLNEMFVNFMIKNEKICGFLKKYDIMIPVPISKKRKQKRGYNQSQIIAKKLVKDLKNLKLVTNVLQKQKNIVPQSTLSKEERKNNVKDAYKIQNEQIIRNKTIILLDDVFTTGSTVEECSRMLKLAGAKQVDVITIAKD